MSTYKSDFLNVLQSRGFIHQVSEPDALDALAARGSITGYIGFDCTAPSLHVGSLVQIMMLHWMQQTGHKPIALMGGGTTRVGDPSGKDESRKILTDADIAGNLAGIRQVFSKFLDFSDNREFFDRSNDSYDPTSTMFLRTHSIQRRSYRLPIGSGALMLNNNDWLAPLNYIDFLREVGKHFSVNRMLAMDSVKLRLEREHELSFLEFNYMILQAYDFVELHERAGCVLQMGGSDQWGNILNGIELGRRMMGAKLFALTSPLLTTSSGTKMGKTASGAIWLNADMLSPFEYWQYWRNTHDSDVARFLKLFTKLSLPEISRLATLKDQEINEAKKVLATEATALVHGREAALTVAKAAQQTFEERVIASNLPTLLIPFPILESGLGILDALRTSHLASSNSEARRQISSGVIRVNDIPVLDDKMTLTPSHLTSEGVVKLSMGRKRHVLLRPV